MPQAANNLFLIDAMSLVFRAFFAPMQMALVSPSGMPTKAIYIFVRTLRKLLKDHQPDHIAVAFDLAAPTFRDKLFEEYKANRPAFPEELAVQLPYVKRFCRALGLPLVELEGFEADDLIGTLARAGSAQGAEVFIVSGDEDLFQLVNDRVRVLKPSRAASDGETLCDAEKVKQIIGVEPAQVVDWLALTGDSSDNIPGARPLPGHEPPLAEGGKKRSYIGPKGATELIQQFGTLEKALENYEQVKKQSYRDALRDFRNEALLSRELATIRTDVPVETSLAQWQVAPLDITELTALCQELGFTSLLREFLEEAPAPAEAAVESEELTTPQAIERWWQSADRGASLALAMSVEGDEGFAGRLTGLGLADGKRLATVAVGGSGTCSPRSHRRSVTLRAARPCTTPSCCNCCWRSRESPLRVWLTTPCSILTCWSRWPPATRSPTWCCGGKAARFLPPWRKPQIARAELSELLRPEIAREDLQKLYSEIELPLAAVLAEVEAAGVRIDAEILARMSGEFDKELTTLTHEIYDLAGGAFDIDSPKQLGEILFEKLKLPGGKRLKKSGQYSTDAAVLEALAEKHDLPRKIIEYRTRAKLKSTYIDALPKFIQPETGRLHTTFNQTVARTGRLSSSNPNLQNIPIGDEFGLRIRSAFVAAPGCQLISADYSQIELRVLAHLSQDPLLIEAFTRNEDIHSRTALEIFGVPPGLQNHEHRRMAKAINYGVIYGLSSFGLAGRTGTSRTEAQRYIDAYFERYSKVKEYLDGLVEQARTTGRVRTAFGRLRPMPEINSADVQARNRAEREAMNTPLQGTAADLMKLAMVKAQARLKREQMQTRMILTVHDELVFEAPERGTRPGKENRAGGDGRRLPHARSVES